LLSPSYAYTVKDIVSTNYNQTKIEGNIVLRSFRLTRLLERCQKVAIFALTIGDGLEEMVEYLSGISLVLKASVLDAIGSGAAENLAQFVEDDIRAAAEKEGLVASRRFSPGYCDWKVNQQKMLFRALGNTRHGVELTDSCLMVPQKSVSGIVGLGLPGNGIEEYNPCISCAKKDCPGRRR
jgi:cobalamin-dependent methionine synthase I